MKIVVMSDTHGTIDLAEDIIMKIGEIDYLVHLGDYYKDATSISRSMDINLVAIKGNCDKGEAQRDTVLELQGHKLFLTHGHRYGVKTDLNKVYYKALELGCDIVLFGHTHMPVNIKHNGVLIMNPGSLSLPRGGSKPSYGIVEIDGEHVESNIIEV